MHTSLMCCSHVRCSSKIIPKNLIEDVLSILEFKNSILLGRMRCLLLDLKMIKDDLLAFKVNLFELNQEFSWSNILFASEISSSMLSPWKNTLVSSANILIFPDGQQLGKSLINNKKNNGPSTEPWGTPQSMLHVFDLLVSITVYCFLSFK